MLVVAVSIFSQVKLFLVEMIETFLSIQKSSEFEQDMLRYSNPD